MVRLVQQPSVDGCRSRVYCGIVRILTRSQDEAEGLSHSVQVFEQLAELGLQGALQEVGEGESNVNSREKARELDTGDWLQGALHLPETERSCWSRLVGHQSELPAQ